MTDTHASALLPVTRPASQATSPAQPMQASWPGSCARWAEAPGPFASPEKISQNRGCECGSLFAADAASQRSAHMSLGGSLGFLDFPSTSAGAST